MRVKELIQKINLPARASLGYLGASLIGKAIGLLTTPFFTRLVSEEQYGVLTLYMTVLGGASVISSAFSSGSAIYGGLNKFRDDIGSFLKSALASSLGFSLTICALLFAFWGYIGLPTSFFLPLVLQIICDNVVAISMARARFRYKYFEVMLVSILTSTIPAVLSILLLIRTKGEYSLRIYLMLLISLILAAIQLIRILRLSGKADLSTVKYTLNSSAPLIPHTLSVALSGQADKLFVTRIMGTASLAKYSVVHSLGIALQFTVTAVGSALGPWIIRKLDRKENAKINSVITILFALFCALSLGLCSVAPEAMRLLAPGKYLEALPALFPIAVSTPLALLSLTTTVALVHSGKGKYTAVISGVNLLLCVILNYTLITVFGYTGAGLALLISQLLSVLSGYAFLRASQLSAIISPMKICGYLAFTLTVGIVTNLFYGQAALRWIIMIVPVVWGIVQLVRCKDMILEAK